MFGLGFGEMVLILIVGIVVVGPRQLPTLMRTAGQWIGKLRRMSTELRSQSGIDDLIRQEGLEKEIQELRALSRVNVIDTLVTTATAPPRPKPAPRPEVKSMPGSEPFREREYPLLGADHYDVLADDVLPYIEPKPETSADGEYPLIGADHYGASADDVPALPRATEEASPTGAGSANGAVA